MVKTVFYVIILSHEEKLLLLKTKKWSLLLILHGLQAHNILSNI